MGTCSTIGASRRWRESGVSRSGPGASAAPAWAKWPEGTEDHIAAALAETNGMSLPRFLQFITHRSGKSAGAIRVSFGIASTFADAQYFLDFAAGLRDQTNLTIGEVTFDIASYRAVRDGSLSGSLEPYRQGVYISPLHTCRIYVGDRRHRLEQPTTAALQDLDDAYTRRASSADMRIGGERVRAAK